MSSFTQTQTIGLTSTSATVYTAPTGKTCVIFSGILSNKASVEGTFSITKTVGSNTTTLFKDLPLPVGSSFGIPKIVLPEGATLNASVGSAISGNADLTLEILVI